MKLYLCSVKLGDSANHVVPNKQVTVPEIAVLKRVHGANAVVNLRPFVLDAKPQVKANRDTGGPWTDHDERERLRRKYQVGEEGVQIDDLFGSLTALPKTLREIGIDPQAAADELRRQAEEMAASANRLAEDDDAPPAADEEDFFEEPPVAEEPKKPSKVA